MPLSPFNKGMRSIHEGVILVTLYKLLLVVSQWALGPTYKEVLWDVLTAS